MALPVSRQPLSFDDFIRDIYTTLSLTVIVWLIEEYRILFDEVPDRKKLMDQILANSTDLDAVQWLCARHLGNKKHAEQLREWMEKRTTRPRPSILDER